MKTAVVGALTIDDVDNCQRIGGPPWYAGTASASLGSEVKVYATVGEDFPDTFFQLMNSSRLDSSYVIKVSGAKSFVFSHTYRGGTRVSHLVSPGPRIPLTLLQSLNADAVIISPVLDELGDEHVKLARERTQILAIDFQGFLREVNENGRIILRRFEPTEEFLKVDVVHMSDEEAKVFSGCVDLWEAALAVAKLFHGVTLIGFPSGLLLGFDGKLRCYEALTSNVINDTTGAGDMLLGFFTTLYAKGFSPWEATVESLERLTLALRNPPPLRVSGQHQPGYSPVRVEWTRSL